MKERIGLNNDYEEYAIHDFELPFSIDEYTSIEEINRLCSLAEELEGTQIGDACWEIQKAFFTSFEEMMDNIDDIHAYPDCNDMSDVAYELIDQGLLGEIPANLINYIDYEAFGRDLELEGNFVVTSKGVFEYVQ